MPTITDQLAEALREADRLLRIAKFAMWKLGLRDQGSNCRLGHEVRMFALEFSPEGRDGPGELQVRGLGAADASLHATSDALASYRAQQAQPEAPSIEAAYHVGATGGPAVEAERLAFEAWMHGHCWALCAAWDGSQYRHDAEQNGDLYPPAVRTRQLWAAWRDRAHLSPTQPEAAQSHVAADDTTGERVAEAANGERVAQSSPQAGARALSEARWPRNAAEVRDFIGSQFCSLKYGSDGGIPCDDDIYTLSAHDLLSAIDWWTGDDASTPGGDGER